MVVGEGFEPSKLPQQIYSLPPLTAREPHQQGLRHLKYSKSAPFQVV
jgi:hypothetical protein